MKLSANAREFVTERVKEAFGKEMEEADGRIDALERSRTEKWGKFEADLGKLQAKWAKDAVALAARHGLTWQGYCGPDRGLRVTVLADGGRYDEVSRRSFVETYPVDRDDTDEVVALRKAGADVRWKIGRAVREALFEIEVHGRKSTLDQIVADVTARIHKEGK